MKFTRITVDPNQMGGVPVFVGFAYQLRLLWV